jgi:alanine dehydrogenase
MRIGVPTEIKESEYRVAITPAGVRELAVAGHEVLVQSGAGEGSFIHDEDYERAVIDLGTGLEPAGRVPE